MIANPIDISQAFSDSVAEIIAAQESVQFKIKCKVMLPDATEVEILPDDVHQLSVLEYFMGDYCSISNLSLDVSVYLYKLLLDNKQGLHLSLELHYDTNDSIPVEGSPLIIAKEYLAILKEKERPEWTIPEKRLADEEDSSGQETNKVPVQLELIPDYVYKLRKTKINCILNKVTMEDTLLFICHLLGLQSVYIVPPDNEKVYANMVLPPLLDISNVFNYLQDNDGYGVYNDGISHYFQDGTLYIMPMNRNLKDSPNKFKIYNVGENAYPSAHNYHTLKDGELNIVVNSKITTRNDSQGAIENNGNAYIVNNPSKHLDNSGELIDNNLFKTNNAIITNAMRYNDMSGIDTSSFTQTYLKSDNMHQVYSMISETETTVIGMRWVQAVPYMITPIMDISYLFDKGAKVSEIKGWPYRVQYNLAKTRNMDNVTFGCTANIFIGCEDLEDSAKGGDSIIRNGVSTGKEVAMDKGKELAITAAKAYLKTTPIGGAIAAYDTYQTLSKYNSMINNDNWNTRIATRYSG